MYCEFYANQNFLGKATHFFSLGGRSHSAVSATSYMGPIKTKNDPGYEFAFSKFSFTYENSRLKQIFLFTDYD